MRKTIWALPLAAVLAAAIGIPSASAATGTIRPANSSTTTTTAADTYNSANDTQNSSVSPMQAGKCTLYGNLSLSRPTTAGRTNVRFSFTSVTSSTTNYDQWHSSWKFIDFDGRQTGTLSVIDGFRMPSVNVGYAGEIDTSIPMSISDWGLIAKVVWTGSC
jgi:hypothetical protein